MCSLLIDEWGSYDVRRSTSVALIGRLLLNYDSHIVVPDRATACDTWFLITDSSAVLQNRSNSILRKSRNARDSEAAKRKKRLGIVFSPMGPHAAI